MLIDVLMDSKSSLTGRSTDTSTQTQFKNVGTSSKGQSDITLTEYLESYNYITF